MKNDKFQEYQDKLPDFVSSEDDFKLFKRRHSAEHVLMQAMERVFGKDKFSMAMGPAIEHGFYFDFEPLEGFQPSEDDFEAIEKEMRKIIAERQLFIRREIPIAEARELFANNSYKQQWLDEIEQRGEVATIYENVDAQQKKQFVDLCMGPHVDDTREIGVVKLLSIAGAYWRGDENNKMLTRIYGTAFAKQKELDEYLHQRKQAEERDHRKLGQELDLFTFSELVGSGLPMFTPRGAVLRQELNELSQGLRLEKGFHRVWTPHITKKELYETSGHWDKFGDELFLVQSQETSDEMVLKPMNCPHHQQIYAAQSRSYRDLPLKYMETTTDYRDEKTGELQGLSRVRAITQDDSHVFCTPEQIGEVYQDLIEVVQSFYGTIDMDLQLHLSFRDPAEPDKYLGEDSLWTKSQKILREIAEQNKMDYQEDIGEAAFYGPKMDFIGVDALGREWQVATIQLDFNQPARFELSYKDADGEEKVPVMVHFAVMGSIERFLSVYIEHTGGAFPLWVAPQQIAILPINDEMAAYANEVKQELEDAASAIGKELRVEVDKRSERLQAKIRDAAALKVPYTLIVGPREAEDRAVSPRIFGVEKNLPAVKLQDFKSQILDKIVSRDSDHSLS